MGYSVYSKFDIEDHKKTYVDYLEVIIDVNGEIMYAVPSHQEMLIRMACEKLDVYRDELMDMCPQEYYCDFMKWLCGITKAVAVWNRFVYAPYVNKKQILSLRSLKMAGIYKGLIPKISCAGGSE